MESGQPRQKQSASEVRREISELRQAILKYVLDDSVILPDLPLLQEFKTEHAQLRAEITAAKDRIRRLQAGRDEYLSVLGRLNTAKTEYEQSQKALAKLHKSLGAAAFAAFQANEIPRQQEFHERIALAERIASLKTEQDTLAAPPDAAILEKTKAKAQQLALAAKIKVEQLSVGKLDAETGRQLIDGQREESVRSQSTSEVLKEVASARTDLASCQHDRELAEQSVWATTSTLSQALALRQIEGKNTFEGEIRSVEKTITEKQIRLSTREREVVDALANNASSLADTPIGEQLKRLADLLSHEHVVGVTKSDVSEKALTVGIFGMMTVVPVLVLGGICFVLFFLCSGLLHLTHTPAVTNNQSQPTSVVATATRILADEQGQAKATSAIKPEDAEMAAMDVTTVPWEDYYVGKIATGTGFVLPPVGGFTDIAPLWKKAEWEKNPSNLDREVAGIPVIQAKVVLIFDKLADMNGLALKPGEEVDYIGTIARRVGSDCVVLEHSKVTPRK